MQWAQPSPPAAPLQRAVAESAAVDKPQLFPLEESPAPIETATAREPVALGYGTLPVYGSLEDVSQGAGRHTVLTAQNEGGSSLYEEASRSALELPQKAKLTERASPAENDPADSRLTNHLNQVGWVALGLALIVISSQVGIYLFNAKRP